jgi:hypothetical protein
MTKRARATVFALLVLSAAHPGRAADVVPPQEAKILIVEDVGDDLVLRWQAVDRDVTGMPETIQGYRVYSTPSADFVPQLSNRVGESTSTEFTHGHAFADDAADYYYLISAVDDDAVEGNRRPPKVGSPSILSVSYASGNGSITWRAAPRSVRHRVFWGTGSLAYAASFEVMGGGVTTSSFGPLAPGSTYYATVLSVDSEDNLSPFASEASINLSGVGIPPGITATATPPPNRNGWNRTDVTVTFSCPFVGNLQDCPPPATLTTEGSRQVVSGTATGAGGSTTVSLAVGIDKTAPLVTIDSPADGIVAPPGSLTVLGSVADTNPISAISCNGVPVVFSGNTYQCTTAVGQGGEFSVVVEAVDVAGNVGTRSVVSAGASGSTSED